MESMKETSTNQGTPKWHGLTRSSGMAIFVINLFIFMLQSQHKRPFGTRDRDFIWWHEIIANPFAKFEKLSKITKEYGWHVHLTASTANYNMYAALMILPRYFHICTAHSLRFCTPLRSFSCLLICCELFKYKETKIKFCKLQANRTWKCLLFALYNFWIRSFEFIRHWCGKRCTYVYLLSAPKESGRGGGVWRKREKNSRVEERERKENLPEKSK